MKRHSFAPFWITLFAFFLVSLIATAVFAQERGFAINHAPAANTVATISQAANANFVHVADCVGITFVAGASAPAAVQVTAVLRDGATGAGTIKQSWVFALPATAGASAQPVNYCGLGVKGTLNTALTLEFTAAGGANTVQSVSLRGHDER